jgi:hypothetical protein
MAMVDGVAEIQAIQPADEVARREFHRHLPLENPVSSGQFHYNQ